MVHHYRHHLHQARKGDEEATATSCVFSRKITRPKLLYLVVLCISSFVFILALHLLCSSAASLLTLYSFGRSSDVQAKHPQCSSVPLGSICCDRSSFRTDICFMEGDVRTDSATFSISVFDSRKTEQQHQDTLQHENIKPYTRKWETSVMNTINELHLTVRNDVLKADHHCDVWHDVPAVFFSTGGYTGNVYHEFNDGILPIYITSQHFDRNVIFVILEYHEWWITKYADILPHLSRYPPIDFSRDRRKHCFPRAIVGLNIHDELTVNPSLMIGNKTIVDFRYLLDKAYKPRSNSHTMQQISSYKFLQRNSSHGTTDHIIKSEIRGVIAFKKPKLVILSRKGSRAIVNEDLLVKMAERIGFKVAVLRPHSSTQLAKLYRVLNSSDVMLGVHGAAMTHFLFMRPGSTFIQIIPLGTDWAAEAYYGEPAKKLGLNYIGYRIVATESSLYTQYAADDPVLKNPNSVNEKGWQLTKKIYLDGQNVILDLQRFQRHLISAYEHVDKSKTIKHIHII